MLLLRASSEINGEDVDLHAVTDSSRADSGGVRNGEALLALADAMVGNDESALTAARQRVLDELAPEQLVDSVAVASNFERMVRIADGTGIPLDDPVEILTSDVREGLGINGFAASANTPPGGPIRRVLRPILRPVLGTVLRFVGRRGMPLS